MVFLKLVACRIVLQLYYVPTVGIAYPENVNAIQGRNQKSLYLEIIVNAITFHVTVTIMNFVLVKIMVVFAKERIVFGYQDGAITQDTFHVTAGAQITPALPHGGDSSILCVLAMEDANVANANAKKYPMDNTRDSTVKILYGYKREEKAMLGLMLLDFYSGSLVLL